MSGDPQMRFNTLNEITKLAAIKATSGLSRMFGFPIGVDVFPVETKKLEEIKTIMPPNEKVVGLSVPIVGSLPGTCLLIYSEKSALAICDVMYHRKLDETQSFSEMEKSALAEVANIITGNFLTSFGMSLQIAGLMHRAAHINVSKFADFMAEMSASLNKSLKGGKNVDCAFQFQNVRIQGLVVFLFDEKEIADLLHKVSA